MVITLIAIVSYIFYLNYHCNENIYIAKLQTISIISCLFDISWLFFGLEDFKRTVTVNFFFRVITVITILMFVKKPEDLWFIRY